MNETRHWLRGGAAGMIAGAGALLSACAGTPVDENAFVPREADPNCLPDGGLGYICGVMNAEDIVPVGLSRYLIASSIGPIGGEPEPGRFYLIDYQNRTAEELFPGENPRFDHDRRMFPNCPGPVDLQAFDSHGLAIRPGRTFGVFDLYMTSHGAREAIEVFELDTRRDKPFVEWQGCVPLPDDMFANSVAILSDGGFVTTKFMDPTNPNAFPDIMAGRVNGAVYEWHPGGEVTMIPGTESSGPNGIEVSIDDRFMFVAAFGGRQVIRYDLQADPITATTVDVGINPDNLRWTEAGTLLTAGGDVPDPASCAEPPCPAGWSVWVIDPSTMEAGRVTGAAPDTTLQGASTALQVANEVWIGTYQGDRIGVFQLPSTPASEALAE